ncbi:MAG: hypothetical protein ACYC9L_12465, partial [Sulfuricaulis sp.]
RPSCRVSVPRIISNLACDLRRVRSVRAHEVQLSHGLFQQPVKAQGPGYQTRINAVLLAFKDASFDPPSSARDKRRRAA